MGLVRPDELGLDRDSVADEPDEVAARAYRSAGVVEAIPGRREKGRRVG